MRQRLRQTQALVPVPLCPWEMGAIGEISRRARRCGCWCCCFPRGLYVKAVLTGVAELEVGRHPGSHVRDLRAGLAGQVHCQASGQNTATMPSDTGGGGWGSIKGREDGPEQDGNNTMVVINNIQHEHPSDRPPRTGSGGGEQRPPDAGRMGLMLT